MGYKNGVLIGLVVVLIGCMLFYLVVVVYEYWLFLGVLFVFVVGIIVL